MNGTDLRAGWIDPEVAAEFPGLRLVQADVPAAPRRAPRVVRERLAALSDRFRGAHAVTLRRRPVPWAYRVFFRHVGLDPDVQRPPLEALAVERLVSGRFASRGLLEDALAIALVETGVPIWALDAAAVDGDLGLRPAQPAERLGGTPDGLPLPARRLVVADARAPVAVLFGDLDPERAAGAATRAVRLFSVQVPNVPSVYVEEALWLCREVLLPEA